MRKQKGCIKTRSIPALFLSVTVKCTIVHLSAVSQEKLKCKHVLYVYISHPLRVIFWLWIKKE